MIISALTHNSVHTIVECLSKSFKGYFVELPAEVSFWQNRFKNARVNYSHSWGVFNSDQLIGFVVNGIDEDNGALTAFNTGTGILQEFRGNKWVDKMYEFGIPLLMKNGVTRCTLEVIDKNERAIRVYERIGFNIKRRIKCYNGVLSFSENVKVKTTTIKKLKIEKDDEHYSWDNKIKTIQKAGNQYQAFEVFDSMNPNSSYGYFIINPANGYIAQLESNDGDWKLLFNGISQICTAIRINNVDEKRVELIDHLDKLCIENTIDQFEMEMML